MDHVYPDEFKMMYCPPILHYFILEIKNYLIVSTVKKYSLTLIMTDNSTIGCTINFINEDMMK